jgi:hypothetical protein
LHAEQILIQRRIAAIEAVQRVPGVQRLWRAQRHHSAHGARRENKSFKPKLSRAGLSSKDSRACRLTARYQKQSLVQQGLPSRLVCTVENEVRHRLFDTSAARRKTASCCGVARSPRRAERAAVVMAKPLWISRLVNQTCRSNLWTERHVARTAQVRHDLAGKTNHSHSIVNRSEDALA